MRSFVYRPGAIPALAWCASVPRGGGAVEVMHGPRVECHERFFFEGAWPGDFAAGGFVDSPVCAGSGGHIGNELVFATPTHTCERLHTLALDDRLLVSNSLVFLLCRAGDGLDRAYPLYSRDILTVVLGLESYRRRLPTREGRSLGIHYYTNLAVSDDLEIVERPKTLHSPFRDFGHYTGTLRAELAALLANAADPSRGHGYEPLTSTSSGYDSTACSLLARDAGCRRSFVIREAQPSSRTGEARDDSGADLARHLGLEVTEFGRDDHRGLPPLAEAEFLASGTGGAENVFGPAEGLLRGSVWVTGFFGDVVWKRTPLWIRSDLRRNDPSGSSLAEFRLRTGFVHFPLPFVGSRCLPSVQAISASEAMAPWSVGGSYDRPIPRRLLEEAGIPRGSFATEKRATGNMLGFMRGRTSMLERDVAGYLGEESLKDFEAFYAALPRKEEGRAHGFRRHFYSLRYAVPEFVKPWLRRRALDRVVNRVQDPRFEFSITPIDWTFHWAAERLRERYEVAPAVAPELGES